MENGDYLASWDDHDLTRRELYRHSPKDAEAYDEYARVMARAAKAIKPIINLIPPDPSSMSIRALMGLLKVGQYTASLSEKELYTIAKLATKSPILAEIVCDERMFESGIRHNFDFGGLPQGRSNVMAVAHVDDDQNAAARIAPLRLQHTLGEVRDMRMPGMSYILTCQPRNGVVEFIAT